MKNTHELRKIIEIIELLGDCKISNHIPNKEVCCCPPKRKCYGIERLKDCYEYSNRCFREENHCNHHSCH